VQQFYGCLLEKERRRYAALEPLKLGRGDKDDGEDSSILKLPKAFARQAEDNVLIGK